ncbi:MAG TPA: hypothetical protein VNJ04_04940 [Gemmatimonadaceae bacterium]|nr:hypothetical protein [Gemmatimonadaceae bacterium]
MTAALSLPDPWADVAEAHALYLVARDVAEERLRRLTRLEDGLVRLLDRIDMTREEIARAQELQIEALRLRARVAR